MEDLRKLHDFDLITEYNRLKEEHSNGNYMSDEIFEVECLLKEREIID